MTTFFLHNLYINYEGIQCSFAITCVYYEWKITFIALSVRANEVDHGKLFKHYFLKKLIKMRAMLYKDFIEIKTETNINKIKHVFQYNNSLFLMDNQMEHGKIVLENYIKH